MYILKGGLLGLVVFAVGSIVFTFIRQARGMPPHSVIGLSVIRVLTYGDASWWLALVGAILIGVWFFRTA